MEEEAHAGSGGGKEGPVFACEGQSLFDLLPLLKPLERPWAELMNTEIPC